MKGIGWIIGGVLLLTGKKSAPAQTGSQLGQYATPAQPRAGSTASRSQASKSSGGGGGGSGFGAPGTQAAGKTFWNALENLFTAPSQNVIPRVDDSPDPGVPDFWATPGTPQGGTTDTLGDLVGSFTGDSGAPQFGGDQTLVFNDEGLLVDPDTGIPVTANTDITTPGGFFPDQFGPDAPPDDSVDPGTDFTDPGFF